MNPPEMIGLVAENSPDFVAQAFAAWRSGSSVVSLRRHDDTQRIQAAGVSEVRTPLPGHGWLEATLDGAPQSGAAQVSFTSGTEGEPKGVVLTHENLADVVARLNSVMRVTSEIREYVGVPVYHSFGFGRCRAVAAAGGRAYLPPRGFNPVEINALLEAGEINAISAVPSLWRILLAASVLSTRARSRVRWIEIGSQSMSLAEKHALVALFPEAIIVQHYGLTEASRSTFLEVHATPEPHLDSVGRPIGAVEVRISPDGRIMIRGPHVAAQMLIGGKPVDPRDAEGWLVTNDRGELRDGYLYYLGRADDMINCGGLKLAPDALEASMRQSLGPIGELAVCRVPSAMRGDGILVAVGQGVSASDELLLEAALGAAAAAGVNARDATRLWRVPALPRTDTGKVKRDALSKQFVREVMAQERSPAAATTAVSAAAPDLRGQLAAILGVQQARDGDTFVSLGGDSLRYIQASVVLERTLGYLPEGWERLGFAELEALPRRSGKTSRVEPAVLLRALAILSVVINHTGVFEPHFAIDGAAFLLLLPAGYSFARFQLQRVIETGKAQLALGTMPRILLPTLLILILQQARHRELIVPPLLLVNNFVNTPGEVFSFWFIEVYVQLHLLLAVVLTSSRVRALLGGHAYAASLGALVGSALLSAGSRWVWDTTHLGDLLPHHSLWYFLLGFCVLFARERWQRWLNTALVIALPLWFVPGSSRAVWIIFGGLVLSWARPVDLPTGVARAVSALASASLYIYVSHFLVLEPVARAFPSAGFIGQLVAALAVGVGLWLAFEQFWRRARALQERRTQRKAALVPAVVSEPPSAE